MESAEGLGVATGLMVLGCWHLVSFTTAPASGTDRKQMDQSIFKMVFQNVITAFGDAVCGYLGADSGLWHY